MLWTLFYSRNLPKNREEHSCGTFWHSYLWCSCCLVFLVPGRAERSDGGRGWKRGDIRVEGIYSARQKRVDITSWETGQSISQPVRYSTIQKERCPSEHQWRIQDGTLMNDRWWKLINIDFPGVTLLQFKNTNCFIFKVRVLNILLYHTELMLRCWSWYYTLENMVLFSFPFHLHHSQSRRSCVHLW